MNVIEVNSTEDIDHPPPDDIEHFCHRVLDYLQIHNWELSVLFCDDQYIKKLNHQYLQKPFPTDVLSFPQEESYREGPDQYHAGDIVISVDTLEKNVDLFHVPYQEELARLIIHAILHLYGMDHQEDKHEMKNEMIQLQEQILRHIGRITEN
jgi:probable rRNA maturation factor